jgi:hypothetical protein
MLLSCFYLSWTLYFGQFLASNVRHQYHRFTTTYGIPKRLLSALFRVPRMPRNPEEESVVTKVIRSDIKNFPAQMGTKTLYKAHEKNTCDYIQRPQKLKEKHHALPGPSNAQHRQSSSRSNTTSHIGRKAAMKA